MHHSRRRGIGPALIVILCLAADLIEDRRVERDLQTRAIEAVSHVKGAQTSVQVEGRDVALGGTSASTPAIEALEATVSSTRGVRLVKSSMTLQQIPAKAAISPPRAPAAHYKFDMEKNGNSLRLHGFVPDQATQQKIDATIASSLPGLQFADELRIGAGAPQEFSAVVLGAISALSRLTNGTLSLDGTSIAVQGVAPTLKDAAEIKSTIEAAVGGKFTLRTAIGVDAALDAKLCQAQVSNLVSNSSIVFAAGSAVLSPTTPGLDALVSLAQRCKSAELVIGGSPADAISLKTDPDLSRHRDEAIVAYLNAIGIGSARVAQRDVQQDRPSELQDGGAALQKSAPDDATYPFTLELGAGSVRLSGNAPDEAARRQIEAAAQKDFFDAKITNELKLASGAPNGFAKAIIDTLPVMARLGTGTLKIIGGTATVSGDALYPKAGPEIRSALASALGSGFTLQGDIAIAPSLSLDPAACQPSFNHLLDVGRINFATDSAVLPPDATPLLDRLVSVSQSCPAAVIRVNGYTDATGTEEHNLVLSRQRAQSVVTYLVDAGVDTARITAIGYGEGNAIASNTTAEGRAVNRHIEFKVIK
jgi:OOP family OmpA-OmpF porin